MRVPAFPNAPGRHRRAAVRAWGFTVVEIMISVGVLALTSMGGISAFLVLNRYAANMSNLSEARALCQERIEQAITLSFRPTNSIVPLAPNSDPTTATATPMLPILGAATSFNTTTGAYTGAANAQTSSENIPIYTQPDGTSAKNSAAVTYTRTTTVSQAPLTYIPPAGGSVLLNVMQFTVTVSYVFHGVTYSTSMSTMRGPD